MDEDQIDPAVNDLARLYALEHMVTTLWYFHVVGIAGQQDCSATQVALELREGILSTVVEGRMPRPLLDLMRSNVAKLLDDVVANARNNDELTGRSQT